MRFDKNNQNINEVGAYLAAIIESSDDAIISKTLDGIITSWNPAAANLFGYTAEEAIGQHITMIIPPERQDEEFIILGKVKSGQRVDHFETVRRRKDGSPVDISLTVSPIRNEQGDIIGASKIARDISALKEAERVSAYLAAIVDSSDDVIISKNLDGIITSWNTSAQRVFGYTPEEAIGKHITMLIPDDKMDEEYRILAMVKSGQRIDHFETKRKTKDGRLLDISLTVSPILDRHGRIIGASKVARDITAQRQTEEALKESNRRKDEFLANISHELRTPMNAVIGFTHILGMSKNLTEKEQSYITLMKRSADNLMGLINNLLDFSKLEVGSVDLEEIEFSLPDIIDTTMNMVSVKAKEKNLALRASYAPGLKKYYIGDSFRLQQVLTNLLSNAVKFTEEGSVEVNVTVKEYRKNKTTLAIEVIDTGIGIPEDKVNVIFEKFTQADASMTRRFGGSGLGLAITKSLVDAMGGTIHVQSRASLGSSFTVELPFKNSERYSTIDTPQSVTEQGRKNVLLVDDYEPNVIVVTAILDQLGYDYNIAENGAEAVRKFQQDKYDVILMDVQMPEMDGYESAQRIRAYEKERHIGKTPIVAMTAHVLERDREKCMESGMNDFLPKPFDPAVLANVLERFIPQEKAA